MFEPDTHPGLLALLNESAGNLDSKAVKKFSRLREFVMKGMVGDRVEFERLFSDYYRLNAGGLTPQFKIEFFRHLYAFKPGEADDPYTPILLNLCGIPRLRQDYVVPASFVSKLVATHDEAQPIYDQSVRKFFGLCVPALGSAEFRIAGFLQHLRTIRRIYQTWDQTASTRRIINRVKEEYPELVSVHSHRIFDFLVWTSGSLNADKPLKAPQ